MTTTQQHLAARADSDLMSRLVAKAELLGLENANAFIQANLVKLITIPVADGQTVTDVYAYAATTREAHIAATPPPPGADPTIVTDAHLETAIQAVRDLPA